MRTFYLETSALVKLYVHEAGTESMLELVARPDTRLAVATIARVELRSALRRRQRAGEFAADVVDGILSRVDRDLADLFLVQPIDAVVVERALGIVDRRGLRAHDALQLAACAILGSTLTEEPLVFASADRELVSAADAEKMDTLDPTRPRA